MRGYDAANRLRTVTDWLNHTSQFDYDATGALSSQTYPNGVQLKLGRDAAGQVISMTQAITATPFLSVTYGHDKLGLLNAANEVGTGADTYTYDARNRLTGDQLAASTTISRTWGYDGATEITATRYQLGVQTPITTTRGYDTADELRSLVEQQGATTTKNLSLIYDAKGNRTSQTDSVSSTIISYSYDQANRLISYNGVWQYGYDGNGLRVNKAGPSGITAYTWDIAAGLPLLLQDGTASYIYGPGGQILEQIQGSTPYYYHSDRLGSVRALTSQAGAVVATYAYDAYGTTTASTGSVANPFRYTGEYQDAESGQYYLRARYYDSATQQFLSRDPLVAVTGQAYNYAGGSPLNATDPSGLYWDTPGDYRGPTTPTRPSLGCFILGLCSPQEHIAKQYYDDLANAYVQTIWNNMPAHIVGGMDDPSGAGQLGRSAALVGLGGPACAPDGSGGGSSRPPLQLIHDENSLRQGSLDFWRNKSTQEIIDSLRPGSESGELTVTPDGRVVQGNTRLYVLQERGIDVNSLNLPRTIHDPSNPWIQEP